MKIIYTSRFIRKYRKLSGAIKDLAEIKEELFRQDPFNPILKTHKLKGALDGLWAFSLDYAHRIIFEFDSGGKAYFHEIGDHSVYD